VAWASAGIAISTQSQGLRFWETPRLARPRLYLRTGASESEGGYWAMCLNFIRSLCMSSQHIVIIVLLTHQKPLIQIRRRSRARCRHRLLALCCVEFSFLVWNEFSKSVVKTSLTWYCIPSAPPVRVLHACGIPSAPPVRVLHACGIPSAPSCACAPCMWNSIGPSYACAPCMWNSIGPSYACAPCMCHFIFNLFTCIL
jgi:hypothetical protein